MVLMIRKAWRSGFKSKTLYPKPILPDVERLAFCYNLVCTVGHNGKPMAGSCLPGLQAVFSKGLFMFVNLCYYK